MGELVLEPGYVIRNRNRLWRVDSRHGDELLVTSIDGGETEQHRFYVPFERIEPGRMDLPDANRVGHSQTNELLLRAYRLSMLHGSAPLLSIQRSSVIPTDYQIVPVIMALDMPRVRMLIADDVGLGKTIESGLIITELVSRQLARNVLIICPANLREQWQEQMKRFFHLDVRIISSRHRRQMERELPAGANPWEFYPYLITSIDYAKETAIKHQILEHNWDLVLIDEAHYIAKPHQSALDQKVEMDRWELGLALSKSKKVKHFIMLTATPHNGYTDSYASLLNLLQVGAVTGSDFSPHISREVARKHICQRRRKDLEHWFKEGSGERSPFPERDQAEIVITLSGEAREAIEAVRDYGKMVLESAEKTRQRHIAQWTVMHLHKRALSSPEALRCSIRNRVEGLKKKLSLLDMGDEENLTIPTNIAKANVLDFDTGEKLNEEEAGLRVERQIFGTVNAIECELDVLQKLTETACTVTPAKDSKLQSLIKDVLPSMLNVYPKAIIFTRYFNTLNYLKDQIPKSKTLGDLTIITLDGSLSEGKRREKFKEFEKAKRAILIATDCISEGVDLQHACAQVIHYELPWNPNRLEQRNGRVDRFGQLKEKVYIRTLVLDEQLDLAILKLLVRKSAEIRDAYGWCPPYFADEDEISRLLEAKGFAAFSGIAGQGVLQFEEPTEDVEFFTDEILKRVEDESFFGQTDIDLPDVHSRLKHTYEIVASPEQIQSFVKSALSRFGCGISESKDGTYRIIVSNPDLQTADCGNVIEKATFDPKVAIHDPDVIVLEVGHPLVRRLIEVVKDVSWREERHYGRTAYRVTPDVKETTALMHVLARYQVQTTPVTIIEELIPIALPIYGSMPLSIEKTHSLLSAATTPEIRTDDEVKESLSDLLGCKELNDIITESTHVRMQKIASERKVWRERLEHEDSSASSWLVGVDQLALTSVDLLTITVLYPA